MSSIIDTAIVGAGPYGLSISAHLKAKGIPYQVFGNPLESWRKMPQGMLLKSEAFASNLWDPQRKFTLERFSAERQVHYQRTQIPLSLTRFLEYAEWFRQGAVGEVHDVKVERIRRNLRNFHLDLADGTSVEARRVILATGYMAFRFTPPEFENLPESLCKHSSLVCNLKCYSGLDCIIIGAGQSALETAALLHEAGAKVRVLARDSQILWNRDPVRNPTMLDKIRNPEAGLGPGWRSVAASEFPQVFRTVLSKNTRHRVVANNWGPAGSWWLRDRIIGKIELLPRHRIQSTQDIGGRVRLVVEGPDGTKEIMADRVIAATGFKINLERLTYLDPEIRKNIAREDFAPALNSSFETSIPGLFLVGAASAPIFGPVMRFMFGAKHASRILARRLSA